MLTRLLLLLKLAKSDGLVLIFTYDGGDPIELPIRIAASVGNSTVKKTIKVCSNPVFYRSSQLGITEPIKIIKPYYLIEYNYNKQEPGPNIFLVENEDVKDRYKTTVNRFLVGRKAVVIFKNFKPYYDKISFQKTFVDFHLEDQKSFSDLIGANNSVSPAKTETAKGNESKTTVTSSEREKNEITFISVLAAELEQFWTDIQSVQPRSEKVVYVLDQVESSIKSCIGGPDIITPASLEIYVKNNFSNINSTDLMRATTALQNIKDYSLYAINTFQIKNMDEIRLSVSYIKDNVAVSVDPDPFVFPVLGGLKLDFSTGFFFSNLNDRKYIIADAPSITRSTTLPDGTVQDQTVSMRKVIEETNSKYKIGFGILSHFYPRLSKWFSLGFTSGFILKDDLAVQFPIGGSLMFGRQSRIILSAGKVFGEANTLSNRYTVGTEIEASSVTNVNSDNLVTKKFGSGWFFAITYNFGGTSVGNGTP
jgi:hypothetical protein